MRSIRSRISCTALTSRHSHVSAAKKDTCVIYVTSQVAYHMYPKNLFPETKTIIVKTHGSELRGQEEAGLHDEPVSYLQVAPL